MRGLRRGDSVIALALEFPDDMRVSIEISGKGTKLRLFARRERAICIDATWSPKDAVRYSHSTNDAHFISANSLK